MVSERGMAVSTAFHIRHCRPPLVTNPRLQTRPTFAFFPSLAITWKCLWQVVPACKCACVSTERGRYLHRSRRINAWLAFMLRSTVSVLMGLGSRNVAPCCDTDFLIFASAPPCAKLIEFWLD